MTDPVNIEAPGAALSRLEAAFRNLSGFGLITPNGVDDTAQIQAAADKGARVYLGPGTFLTTATINVTPFAQFVGMGRGLTIWNHSVSTPAIQVTSTVEVQSGFVVSDLTLNAMRGICLNTSETDGVILGASIARVTICGTTTTTNSSDPLWSTTNLLDASGTAAPSATTITASMPVTFADVESRHGYGISMTKVFDSVIDNVTVRNSGVAWVTKSCDINEWRNGRMHEVAWFHYDERGATFGSQNRLSSVDLLHNRRAGGIVHNCVKFPRVRDCYYECYVDSALWIWQKTVEGGLIIDNRVDDTWYGTSRVTPLMVLDSPRWYNKIERNDWQHFTAAAWTQPIVRVIGAPSADGNHPEVLASTNNSIWWPKVRGDALPGIRVAAINPQRCAVGNFIYNPGSVSFTLDGTEYAMTTTASGIFPEAYVQLPTISTSSAKIRVRAKSVAANEPGAGQIRLTIELMSQNLALKAALSGSGEIFSGFSSSAYTTVEIPITLDQALLSPTDFIRVTWVGNAANVVSIEATT